MRITCAHLWVIKYNAEQKLIGLEDLTELRFDTDDLEIVDPKQFKLYEVDKNCELGSFMARCGLRYRIGSVYYEFFRKEEIITEDKDIILMKSKVIPSMPLIGPNVTVVTVVITVIV